MIAVDNAKRKKKLLKNHNDEHLRAREVALYEHSNGVKNTFSKLFANRHRLKCIYESRETI